VSDSIVIIPTYNEKENIEAIIEAVFSLSQPFDVLIVDDNSPDGTASIVESLQQKHNATSNRLQLLKRQGKHGLGTAYLTGFEFALSKNYEYIMEMDADFSHDPKDLISLRKKCVEEKSDMSIGSRYATGVNVVN
jgi:dolichol-phosphate mannosyltransferase